MMQNLSHKIPLIDIRHLTVGYDESIILTDVSLTNPQQ